MRRLATVAILMMVVGASCSGSSSEDSNQTQDTTPTAPSAPAGSVTATIDAFAQSGSDIQFSITFKNNDSNAWYIDCSVAALSSGSAEGATAVHTDEMVQPGETASLVDRTFSLVDSTAPIDDVAVQNCGGQSEPF
jgi:hypothetical protein